MSNYRGLVNEGATCYLNSLLQTLFMTEQFRRNVYAYQHDRKKIEEKNSIPYQLQKLFVKLQTGERAAYTQDLLKSFQWQGNEAFQQHDVQQFCRILFQAIESAHKNTAWIKQLFQGSWHSYVDCGKHKSIREQVYMDIALPIRNQYTMKTYQSIEESLKEYMRPEKLEDKFQCQGCGQKVIVQKGMMLSSVPPLLTLQLNRFQLNYQTFQRQKVNSFFYFPQILELHRFMMPYDDIKIKGLPPNIDIKTVTVAKESNPRTINFSGLEADKPRTRKKSDDKIGKKQTVTYFDEQNRDKRVKQQKQLSKQDDKQKHLEILNSLKSEKGKFDTKMKKIKQKQLQNLEEDMLFGMSGMISNKDWATAGSFEKEPAPTFEKKVTHYQHEQEAFDPNKQYPDLTYALFAVLVHSGGSFGGHYFAYISDGVNWYRFDDSTVTKVNRSEIRKYGVNSNSTIGTNAYLLFYRDTKTFKELKDIQVPKELLQKIIKEQQKKTEIMTYVDSEGVKRERKVPTEREERINQISKSLVIRVYKEGVIAPMRITVFDKNEQSMNTLRFKIKAHFNIEDKDENWRLRRYNKVNEAMYEVYGASDVTLQQMDYIVTELMVEVKTDNQIFQEFDPRKITIKISVWQQNAILIVQRKSKTIKIPIHQDAKFQDLYDAIKRTTNIKNPLVIKRTFSRTTPFQKLTLDNSRGKRLLELQFFHNYVVYVEEQSQEKKTKWQVQFQNQRHRCLFSFNNPKKGEEATEQFYFDTRKTLGELKTELSKVIGIAEQHFRIKKGKKALSQMTAYKKKLQDLRFINTQTLYLEEGVSNKGSVIIHRGQVNLAEDKIQFNVFEEFQFELGNDLLTVADLCWKLSQKSGFHQDNIRVREFKNHQFKQIFTPTTQIHRIRQKSLVWEWIQDQIPKGMQIYFRVFDVLTFQFGPLKNLYADSSSSYQELSLLIEEETGIQSNKILVWKPLSNFIEKQYILDVDWVEIRYIGATIKQEPFLIRTDGQIIIVKQADQVYEPPKVRKTTGNQISTKPKAEAQLKITVIAENQDPPERQTKTQSIKQGDVKVDSTVIASGVAAQQVKTVPADIKPEAT